VPEQGRVQGWLLPLPAGLLGQGLQQVKGIRATQHTQVGPAVMFRMLSDTAHNANHDAASLTDSVLQQALQQTGVTHAGLQPGSSLCCAVTINGCDGWAFPAVLRAGVVQQAAHVGKWVMCVCHVLLRCLQVCHGVEGLRV
jgi:hypothetical protein